LVTLVRSDSFHTMYLPPFLPSLGFVFSTCRGGAGDGVGGSHASASRRRGGFHFRNCLASKRTLRVVTGDVRDVPRQRWCPSHP
jgi:hypothetical protein